MVALLLALGACGRGPAPEPAPGRYLRDSAQEDSGTGETGGEPGDTEDTPDDTSDTYAPPPDADGDGYGDAAYGGDDCNDAEPSVHPGGEEWCDGLDRDCDGEPYGDGACSKQQDISVLTDGTWDGDTGLDRQTASRFVGDLDGDGTEDVILEGRSATADEEWPGDTVSDVLFVPGGQALAVGTPRQDAAAASWHADWWSTPLQTAYAAGDVDGDGHPDLWLLSNDEYGAAALMRGPPDRWGKDLNFVDHADVAWFGEAYRDGFAMSKAATDVDFDSDGFQDAAFMSFSDGSGGSDGAVYLVYGGSDVAETRYRYAADETWIPCDSKYDVASGDVTGDGVPDVLLGRGSIDTVTILDGATLSVADGTDCDDLAASGVVLVESGSFGHGLAVIGDWDGDGLEDWVAEGGTNSTAYGGSLLLFSGAPPGGSAMDLAYAQFVGEVLRTDLGHDYPRALADLTGDGIPEIGTSMVPDWASDADSAAVIIPSGRYSGLALPLPENTLLLGGGGLDENVGSTSTGDFDGDGLNDILADSYWGVGRGRTYLLLGGIIPWDDATAW